jgi:hypothetical protein
MDKTLLEECCEALDWQGGTIYQIKDVLFRTKWLIQLHKEAELTGNWKEFKGAIYSLRVILGENK